MYSFEIFDDDFYNNPEVTYIGYGEYGIDEKGRVIDYAKKTKVGKQVKSFLIYNPTTKDSNVIAYVDHKMIR